MFKVLLQILICLVRFFTWFFAIGTFLAVCWMFLMCVRDMDSHCTMMSNGITQAWGLTYTGWGGAILSLVEAILVVGALCVSRTRHLAYRSLGHLILILWAGMWLVNAFSVFADGTFRLIYIMPLFFLCTCLRAALDFHRPSKPDLVLRVD